MKEHTRAGSATPDFGLRQYEDPVNTAALFEDAVRLLQEHLWADHGAGAARYLTHSRAIPKTIALDFRVGYLPALGDSSPSVLTDAMRACGYRDDHLMAAGIAVRGDRGALVDKPRGGGYLALPLTDPDGSVIGIKYRAIPGEVSEDARRFDATSSALAGTMFGFDRLPDTADTVIAVEGELDQLSLAAAREADPSLPPAVAWHGKELSGDRLALLSGRARHVVLMLDADDGGFDGILRGGRKLARAGVTISVVRMPAGVDPNELLRAGDAAGLARAVHHLPRVSLFEEHARVFTRFGPREINIARTDPTFVASELRETADALACAALDPDEVERGAALVNLEAQHFATYVARSREARAGAAVSAVTDAVDAGAEVQPEEAHSAEAESVPELRDINADAPRVQDYDVAALLDDAVDVDDVVTTDAQVGE